MNCAKIIIAALALSSGLTLAGAKDDPLLAMWRFDQLEARNADDITPLVIEGQGWLGYDLNKVLLKTELERARGETEEAEAQFLFSRAIAPFWDVQVGVRRDFLPDPTRNWAVVGLQGIAPYFFEVDAAIFIGESGRSGLRLEAEYELMLTQRWVLSPEVELNFYGHNDSETGAGSGLSDAEAGLRLRYEIRREIAPYIGIHWQGRFGEAADMAEREQAAVRDTQLVAGIRLWW